MTRPLREENCVGDCNWRPNGEMREGERLFVCTGCEAEWVRSTGWVPHTCDGRINKAVQDELAGK